MLTDGDNDYHEGMEGWPSLSAVKNVVRIKWTPVNDEGDEDEVNVSHFRAVVVEGEQPPIVLDSPEELGLSWEDGRDLLTLTSDGITLWPRGLDEWGMSPAQAREMAAHLAAMADACEAAGGGSE